MIIPVMYNNGISHYYKGGAKMLDISYLNLFKDNAWCDLNIRYIVSLSGGCSSAVTAKRTIEKYGKDRVELVFCDTLIEDDDNYRFLNQLEDYFDKPIVRLAVGLTPFELSEKASIIPNSLFAPCTFKLKIEPMQNYVKKLQKEGYTVVMEIGMNASDAKPRSGKPHGRLDSPRKNWAKLNVLVEYPCLWHPIDSDSVETVKSWGISPPEMYSLGYTHANCGGTCVKQGQKDWRKTLIHHPDRFKKVAEWERHMIEDVGIGDGKRAIMKRTVNGVTEAYKLSTFENEHYEKYLTNAKIGDMLDDMGDVCGVECGVATFDYDGIQPVENVSNLNLISVS